MEQNPSREADKRSTVQEIRNSPPFMEPENWLMYSQEPTI
jgi:hypothetical protein